MSLEEAEASDAITERILHWEFKRIELAWGWFLWKTTSHLWAIASLYVCFETVHGWLATL